MATPVRFKAGLRANLPAVGIDKTWYYCTDTKELFIGTGTGMDPVGGAVSSVAGRTGAITLSEADIAGLTADLAGKQNILGFTPENAANKAQANGYASLDSSTALPAAQMPASLQAAGTGWFWAWFGHGMPATTGSSLLINATAVVYVVQVLFPVLVRKISVNVTGSPQANSNVYVALYDMNKNLIAGTESGPIVATSTGVKTVTVGTPFLVLPGTYYVFVGGDHAGVALNSSPVISVLLQNTNVARMATPANVVSGGAVPASLGALTITNINIVHVLFEA